MAVTIVTSVIVSSNPQADGRFSVRERHTDSLGNNYFFDYLADQAADQNVHLASTATNILPPLAQAEIGSNISSVQSLGSLAVPVFLFSTVAANVAALRVAYLIATQSQAVMIGDYLSSLTTGQLQSAFGLTVPQITTLRANFLTPASTVAANIRASVGT